MLKKKLEILISLIRFMKISNSIRFHQNLWLLFPKEIKVSKIPNSILCAMIRVKKIQFKKDLINVKASFKNCA